MPQVPLLNTAANHTRAGLYGALWWVSFMLIILSFDSDKSPKQRQAVTTVTFAVMAPAGLVAAACAHGFLVWMTRKPRLKFRCACTHAGLHALLQCLRLKAFCALCWCMRVRATGQQFRASQRLC